MRSRPFYWYFIRDPFHSYFYRTTATVSLISNVVLIATITKNKTTAMDKYRYLLLCFAVTDMITSLTHSFVAPIVHLNAHGMYFFPKHVNYLKSDNGVLGKVVSLVYIMTYYETFNLLAFHFIYRYRVLVEGRFQQWTFNWRMMHWLVAGGAYMIAHASLLLWSIAKSSLTSEYSLSLDSSENIDLYGVNTSDPTVGYVLIEFKRRSMTTGLDEWDSPTLMMFAIYISLFGLSASVMVGCSASILEALKGIKVSNATKLNQRMLFRALLLQTFVPCAFSYFPLCILWFYPLITEVALGGIGTIMVMSSAIFPSVDALIIIYFIPAYRSSVTKFILNRVLPAELGLVSNLSLTYNQSTTTSS